MNRRYLKASEVARLFQVDHKTIHNWVDKGKLPAFHTPGNHLRFVPETVRALMLNLGWEVPAELIAACNTQNPPLDASSCRSIKAVLATLPEVAGKRFLAWFGIQRVEDLPAARLESALDRLVALEIEYTRIGGNTCQKV